MVKQPDSVIGFRANSEDRKIMERLKKKLGVSKTAVIKQALRCLDKKEGKEK